MPSSGEPKGKESHSRVDSVDRGGGGSHAADNKSQRGVKLVNENFSGAF
jgi:hypothetical protein